MGQTVVGLFDDRDHAQKAVRDFIDHKFNSDKVSIVTTDPRGEFVRQPVTAEPGNQSGQGAAVGALSGAVVGGIFGLLVGASVLVIPGLGLLAAGPIVATAAGAGIGLIGGGLLGALIGLGIPKDQVQTYAEAIRRGGCVVAVEVADSDVARANEIMKKHNAVDVHQRSMYYQAQGFKEYDPNARPFTEEEAAAERERVRAYEQSNQPILTSPPPVDDATLRARFADNTSKNLTYNQWEPAYRFGWQTAQNPQMADFTRSEDQLRQMWEESNPGSYQMYRDAIYSGYSDAFSRRSGAKLY
jgi:hypothetical protein